MKHMIPTETGAERAFFSVSDVAARLGVSRVTIWRWIGSGKLPATRLGHRTVRVLGKHLDKLAQPALAAAPAPLDTPLRTAWLSATPDHLVLFYDAERFLLDGVAEFMLPTLRSGERSVIVATAAHREGIEERLAAAGVDVRSTRGDGLFVAVDAAETLSRFMVGDAPDARRFGAVARELIGPTRPGRRARPGSWPRVFGEMVALLADDGNTTGALKLETLWNQQQKKRDFSLLCGYPMHQFGGHSLSAALADACSQHSSVVPTERYSELDSNDARLREVAMLQQKAASLKRALAAERAARDEAEAALRVRDEFLSIASHELRTPITILGAQAQLSLRRLAREGQLEPERVEQALRTMGSQANKLARLVSHLLDVSRLETGKLALEYASTDLVGLVDQVITATLSLTDRHTINFSAPDHLRFDVDALRVEQVLTNLLDNAIKFSPDGGLVEVVLSQPSPACAELSVRDRGVGIPPEKRSQIFERFFQADECGRGSGMGLGLYVCRRIVQLHGGELRAEFPPDGGTRMVVELPLAQPSVHASIAAD
jgi:excisionase family DNA binding protein